MGVFETLKGIARRSIASVRQKVGPDAIWPKTPAAPAGSAGVEEPALEMPTLEVTPPKAFRPVPLSQAVMPRTEPAIPLPPPVSVDEEEEIALTAC